MASIDHNILKNVLRVCHGSKRFVNVYAFIPPRRHVLAAYLYRKYSGHVSFLNTLPVDVEESKSIMISNYFQSQCNVLL